MGAQGIEDLPDNFVTLVVIQRVFGFGIRRDGNGQDDIAQFLTLGPAHDAPNRLHHVDLAFARVHEHDGVQCGHVHAFRQYPGIGQNAASVFACICLEPVQHFLTRAGI